MRNTSIAHLDIDEANDRNAASLCRRLVRNVRHCMHTACVVKTKGSAANTSAWYGRSDTETIHTHTSCSSIQRTRQHAAQTVAHLDDVAHAAPAHVRSNAIVDRSRSGCVPRTVLRSSHSALTELCAAHRGPACDGDVASDGTTTHPPTTRLHTVRTHSHRKGESHRRWPASRVT